MKTSPSCSFPEKNRLDEDIEIKHCHVAVTWKTLCHFANKQHSGSLGRRGTANYLKTSSETSLPRLQ